MQGLQEIILKANSKLVIIDSVASLIRKEFDGESTTERNDMLSKEASILKSVRIASGNEILMFLLDPWPRGFPYRCWCRTR